MDFKKLWSVNYLLCWKWRRCPLWWVTELCGCSSCVWCLRSLLNIKGILTLPMFLLSDRSVVQMWCASFFKHSCHLFHFLKYSGQVGNQHLQEGTNIWRKVFTTKRPSSNPHQRLYLHHYCGSSPGRWIQWCCLQCLYHGVNRILNTYTNKLITYKHQQSRRFSTLKFQERQELHHCSCWQR